LTIIVVHITSNTQTKLFVAAEKEPAGTTTSRWLNSILKAWKSILNDIDACIADKKTHPIHILIYVLSTAVDLL